VEELHIELVVLDDQDGLCHSPSCPFVPNAHKWRLHGRQSVRARA